MVDDKAWAIGANAEVSPDEQDSVDYYPWFESTSGRYIVLPPILSPQLNNTRQTAIYFPPSYRENTLKPMTNVLLMHDGENVFNGSLAYHRYTSN